jgi:hypothetical protein
VAVITVVRFGMLDPRIESEVAGFLARTLDCEVQSGTVLA